MKAAAAQHVLRDQLEAARPRDLVGLAVLVRYDDWSADCGPAEHQVALLGNVMAELAGVELRRDPEIRTEAWS